MQRLRLRNTFSTFAAQHVVTTPVLLARSWWRIRWCYLLAAICCLLGFLENSAGADPSLHEIQKQLDRFTRLIERLEGKQFVAFKRDKISRNPGDPLIMEDLRIETDFKIDFVHGRTSLVDKRSWYYREISPDPFTIEGEISRYNGEIGYSLHTTPGHQPLPHDPRIVANFPPNFPHVLLIRPKEQKDQTAHYHNIWRLAGLPCSGPNVSLAAALSATDARIVQKRVVDGIDCIEIAATVGDWKIEAVLDPNVSWLPRRYFAAHKDDPSGEIFTYEHIVKDFKTFIVETSNEKVWFPAGGIRIIPQAPVHLEMTLVELTVNAPMVDADFEVDVATLPPGVQVRTPESTTYTGDDKDLFLAIDKAIDEKTQAMQSILARSRGQSVPPSQAVRVRSSSSNITIWTVVLASLVLIMTVIRLTQNRSPS